MRIVTVEGFRVWLNPARIDSMHEGGFNTGPNGVKDCVQVMTLGKTYLADESFDVLADRLDDERKPNK